MTFPDTLSVIAQPSKVRIRGRTGDYDRRGHTIAGLGRPELWPHSSTLDNTCVEAGTIFSFTKPAATSHELRAREVCFQHQTSTTRLCHSPLTPTPQPPARSRSPSPPYPPLLYPHTSTALPSSRGSSLPSASLPQCSLASPPSISAAPPGSCWE